MKIKIGIAILFLALVFNIAEARSTIRTRNLSTVATSSVINLTKGGSATTLNLYTPDVDKIGLNLMAISTSTPPTLQYRFEFSENAVDWFAESRETTQFATSTQITSTFTDTSWLIVSSTGGTSNTSLISSFIRTPLKDIASTFTRIVFSVPSGSPASLTLFAQAVMKSITP